jgi:hypothetical protein
VESEEIEIAINELEVRLERLRALYEQYFLGFEKIEPTVARKDVDRRIYVLRREKIRNTARRFRLQNIIQRYNTFQQYWQRICREIENGTYKRHLLRAERTVGPTALMTAAARRRFGKERERSSAPPAASGEAAPDSRAPASRRSARPGAAPSSSRPSTVSPTPQPVEPKAPAPRPPGAPPPPPRRPPPLPPGASAKPAAPNASTPAAQPFPPTRAPGAPPPPPTRAAPPPPRPSAQAARPQAPSEQSQPRAARPVPAERAASADPKARELHERLVAASKAAKRPAVSLQSLEKTMKATEATLRAKHPNRRIEFDIVLKDGKPVLKPIVR